MKRLYNNTSKLLLAVGCTVFAFTCIMSLLVCAYFQGWKMYSNDKNAFSEYMYDYAGYGYATLAFSDSNGNFNQAKLNKMNCYYGIIDGPCTEDLDYDDPSIYLYKNFDSVVPENAFLGFYSISPDTEFVLSDKFMDFWGGNQVIDYAAQVYKTYAIEGIGYDSIGQKLYVYANNRFYPVSDSYYCMYEDYIESEEELESTEINSIYSKIWDNYRPDLVDYTEGALFINGVSYEPLSETLPNAYLEIISDEGNDGDLLLNNVADLSVIHEKLDELKGEVSFDNYSRIGRYESNPDSKDYTFVCFPKEEFNGTNDYYAQAKHFIEVAKNLKYVFPIAAIISFILSIGCFVFFLCAVGHKKDSEEIHVGIVGKILVDVCFVCFLSIEYMIFSMFYWAFLGMRDNSLSTGMTILIEFLFTAAAMAVGLAWTANFAVNVKKHQFFRNSLLYKILNWLKKKFVFIKEEWDKICGSIKWTRRIWCVYIVITIGEYLGLTMTDCYRVLPFWFFEKILFTVVLFKLMAAYARIKSTAMLLAEGDTSAKVELKGLPPFLKEHATAMNQIGEGVNVALEERTKSERMKTELITNVSHDIKTPLTSIINYVDLLKKEKLDNEKAKEYLSVLSRQSNRLKKLIEDLIEASKASTGNIKFTMEDVNAGVLLNQSIGEFIDRLEANNITLVTDVPSEAVYLRADNRYLWRVFDNLMSNIVKYAQPDTRAYIDLVASSDKVVFTFRNTSKNELNISADELMERFVRGDKSRFTDGNGLGLSIAKSLTESMGGQLNLSIDGDLFKSILEFDRINK